MKLLPALATSLLIAAAGAQAAGTAPAVRDAWSRETAPVARNGVVYFHLHGGSADDELLGAESPVAAVTEIHEMKHEGGAMQMRRVQTLPVKAGSGTDFAPGGLHLMLINLKSPLVPGAKVPFTLNFRKAGRV
ncbi:MAG: copper chaperone PCu(A)C, partial [Moraxellaceae bacterium]